MNIKCRPDRVLRAGAKRSGSTCPYLPVLPVGEGRVIEQIRNNEINKKGVTVRGGLKKSRLPSAPQGRPSPKWQHWQVGARRFAPARRTLSGWYLIAITICLLEKSKKNKDEPGGKLRKNLNIPNSRTNSAVLSFPI